MSILDIVDALIESLSDSVAINALAVLNVDVITQLIYISQSTKSITLKYLKII